VHLSILAWAGEFRLPVRIPKWTEGFSPTQACTLLTQQHLELPRGVHDLALPMATDRKRISE
jgi:hypothetical protein